MPSALMFPMRRGTEINRDMPKTSGAARFTSDPQTPICNEREFALLLGSCMSRTRCTRVDAWCASRLPVLGEGGKTVTAPTSRTEAVSESE